MFPLYILSTKKPGFFLTSAEKNAKFLQKNMRQKSVNK